VILPAPNGPIYTPLRLYVPKETPPSILPAGEGQVEAASDAGAVTRSSEKLACA